MVSPHCRTGAPAVRAFFADLPAPDERAQIWELHVRKHIHAAPRHAGFVFDDALRADPTAAGDAAQLAEAERAVEAASVRETSDRRYRYALTASARVSFRAAAITVVGATRRRPRLLP